MASNSEKAPPPEYQDVLSGAVAGDWNTGLPLGALNQAAAAIEGNAAGGPSNEERTAAGDQLRSPNLYVRGFAARGRSLRDLKIYH